MFNTAIRSIIDLLKLRKDTKKTDLEIEKLERERKKADSRIELASFKDVERFDPFVRKLLNMFPFRAARKKSNLRRNLIVFIIAVIILIIAIILTIYKYFA